MSKYIKLEDVSSVCDQFFSLLGKYHLNTLKDRINSLPQYNPEFVLKEMIEEGEKNYDDFVRSNSRDEYTYGVLKGELGSLIKALSRITNK